MDFLKTLIAVLLILISPLLFVGLLMSMSSSAGAELTDRQQRSAILEASKAVVQVAVPNYGKGSGVFISPTQVVTNCHVVSTSQDKLANAHIQIYKHGTAIVDKIVYVTVNGCNMYQDIAVVTVVGDYKSKHYVDLYDITTSLPIAKLDYVWAAGHPAGAPLVITRGYYQFSGRIREGTFACRFFSAPITRGNSGGALFWIGPATGTVKLIGLPTASPGFYEHLHCAVLAEDIVLFIESGYTLSPVDLAVTVVPPYFIREVDEENIDEQPE